MHLLTRTRERSMWRVFREDDVKPRAHTVPAPEFVVAIAADGVAVGDQVGASIASGVMSSVGKAVNDLVGIAA